ncbi:hypothetical protein BSLG_005534 [Batrachochytrium salamandrivorans]|nr:hypothetical protein BSLG_005534 [Batrachochytrium salamandrivorans]
MANSWNSAGFTAVDSALGPENSSALKAELSIHRSEHRSKVAKFVILGLLFIQAVLSAWIFYDCLQTSATFSRAVVNYPGQALLIVTWLIALVMYSLAAGVDSYIPTSTASSHPLGAPVYTGLLWLAFTRLVSVPIDIRLVWIVCEAHPTTVSYCSSKDITATIAETNASIWSRITFSWMDDVISLGFDRPLDLDDLNHLIPQDRSDSIITAYEGCCNANRSLIGNLAVFFAPSLAIQAVFSLVTAFATLASPYFLRKIIIFTENPASVSHPSVAVFYALAIFTFTFIRSVCDGQMYFIGRRIGLRIRSIVIMLVYDKSLRPASHPDLHIDGSTQELGASSGKIVNLMSSDAFKILRLAGVAVMVVMIPLGGVIGRLVSRLQKRLMESTDMRINAINELLQGIRVIKFFAWEPRFFTTPVLVSFLTFVSMTWLAGRDLDASTAFTALSLFNVLECRFRLSPILSSSLWRRLLVRRIENYLKEPEIASSVDVRAAATRPVSHLKKLTLQFPKGALSVVYGPTGCGKSSLLMAILGEMHLNSGGGGGVHLGPLQRGTTHLPIAFASQQVWLQNATIRENICFGTPFDSDRYQATLIACSLVKDLDNMDGGDLTEVGEKGVNLSGGQKARISLALDAPTARHIFDKCICGPLLAGRTRILVTHAKALCAPKADFVVRLSMGSVRNAAMSPSRNPPLSEGPELSTTEPIFPAKQIDTMPPPSNHQQKQHADVLPSVTVEDAVSSSTVKRITIEEARSSGSVPFRTYWVYLSSAGGPVFVLFVVLTYILAQGLMISTDLWLKTWVSAYHTPNYATDLSSFSSLKGTLIQSSGTQWIVDDASLLITKSLFYSMDLNHTRVAETSPRTIITQWLGTSQSLVDLPFYIGIYALLGTLAIIAVLFRVWIIARGSLHASRALHNRLVMKLLRAPVQFFEKTPVGRILNRVSKDMKDIDQEVAFFTGDFFGNLFVARELKRLDSTTRSPIFSHFGETISGASTIRAYAAQDRFVKETHRSGSLITLASALASVLAVLFDDGINPGLAGLSISYALLFTDSLLWVIRMHALMEMEINAVERVGEYLQIEEEAPATIPGTCLDPLVREKVAVVGRTGAGKTTLSLAFFRFLEFDTGSITIDGVDISSMGLHDLRSCLTVIPQDPVLFSGTLRSNLDPFSEHTDAEIWSCLNHSHFIESLRQESLSTSSSVSTRALLRRSRVVLLDEATASVDHDTDLRIQLTIRNEFRKATLLCIAHRLRTIIDYDKVLVLDKGRVAQFASPHELLSDHDGIFYAMCAETGELDELKAAAAKHG